MLDIVVCVKQVPDVSELRVDPTTHTLIREGVPSILNPYDAVAVETALRLKNRWGGRVTIVSMGPPQARTALEECIAMGADEAILLSDRAFAAADTWATAYALSQIIQRIHFDLILCGKKAIDAETGQVGPQLAEFLEIPHVTYAQGLDILHAERKVLVKREREDGLEVIECSFPVLVTVLKDLNEPRSPTLAGILKAKRTPIKIVNSVELGGDPEHYGLRGSPTIVAKIFPPSSRSGGVLLRGKAEEVARNVIELLVARNILSVG